MTRPFSYQGSAATIVFGDGASAQAATRIAALGCARALVLSTPQQADSAQAFASALGPLAVGTFAGAAMHTPVDVTARALRELQELRADCVVSFGGGSTTGLGKALANRSGVRQIAIPTTYAGSEVTPILGQTEGGAKTTLRSARVLPDVVIYDPALTLNLPVTMSMTSGLNAIAHAAEGLYAADRNPISTLMAIEGLRALKEALPAIVANPRDPQARSDALYGAWLCGTVLGTVGMALHHKLCHTLGGSFDMPHAETHAILLPHTIGFNAVAVPDLLAPVATLFGDSPGQALYDFAATLPAPRALKDFGLKESDLDRAADLATRDPYANPRAIDRDAIRTLLNSAWQGNRPPN